MNYYTDRNSYLVQLYNISNIYMFIIHREGHKEVAENLLNHNADVELPDNYGQSPLFMACWKGDLQYISYMCQINFFSCNTAP